MDRPSGHLRTEVDFELSPQIEALLPEPRTAGLARAHSSLARDAAAIIKAVDTLDEAQRSILDFERRWWRQPGAKEQAIRDNFEMSPTRYYQTLNALLDRPEALSYDPTLVNRLQRLRSSASRGRRLR